jgi:hypothetical protein
VLSLRMEDGEAFFLKYTNMLADITIGKNAQKHMPDIREGIDALNNRVDNELLAGRDGAEFQKLAYWFYKLKDEAEKLIVNP